MSDFFDAVQVESLLGSGVPAVSIVNASTIFTEAGLDADMADSLVYLLSRTAKRRTVIGKPFSISE